MALTEYRTGLSVEPGACLEISELSQGGEDEWDRFVLASPNGTFFHLSGWAKVVEHVLGRRTFSFMARDASGIRGVFPISLVRSRLFGKSLVSSPLAVYGGICADDADSYAGLLRAGQGLADRLGVKYLEMRNRTEPFPTDLPGRDLYVTFTQDLSPAPEKLMKALPRDTRYAIRKSMKSGLQWSEEVTIAQFYEIYARSVHRLGTPVFSKKLFETLRSVFPRQTRLFAVRKENALVAAVFCLYFRDQVLPYYAGALPEFYKDAPNNFMYWSLMAQSCGEGYKLFDFGRSKRGTGSFEFKSAWSMEVTPLPYRYYLARAKEVPQMSPVDPKFQLPVRLWKRMPFGLTKIIGPPLIRRIPSV